MRSLVDRLFLDPFQRLADECAQVVPLIIIVLVTLIIGGFVAFCARWITYRILRAASFDRLVNRTGFGSMIDRSGMFRSPSDAGARLVQAVVWVFVMLFALSSANTPVTTNLVSRFVDYSNADGMFRKYRIVLIDGRPFICHYAISQHWMIHYLNAGMTESAEKRAEEAACMAGFDEGFAKRQRAALQEIDRRMGLPYLGIDCAEMPNGDLLVFEADNAMVVHAMDPVDMFPYKVPAMRKVFHAFRDLLQRASGRA